MNYEQRHAPEEAFHTDLTRLQGIYATSLIENVAANADFLIGLYGRWHDALTIVGERFTVNNFSDDIPRDLERVTRERLHNREHAHTKGTILGLAGPGAAGKGTLAQRLGYPRVINTTTRPARAYEADGVHYHFLKEESFYQAQAQGEFATVTERPGRGLYATAKKDLAIVTGSHSGAAIIEENPATLTSLSQAVKDSLPETDFILTYILPPEPVPVHLALRLAGRCLVAGEDYRHAVESTLGHRQIDEFLSVLHADAAGVPILFVVNDSVERAIEVVQSVVSGR